MSAPTAQASLATTLRRARKAAGFSNAKAFLEALRAAEGTAPSYSTYAQWESGEVTPRDESLVPVRRYHEGRGTWVEAESAPDLPTALLALARELAALREERQALAGRVADLEAQVAEIVASAPSERETSARAAHGAPAQ